VIQERQWKWGRILGGHITKTDWKRSDAQNTTRRHTAGKTSKRKRPERVPSCSTKWGEKMIEEDTPSRTHKWNTERSAKTGDLLNNSTIRRRAGVSTLRAAVK